MQCVGGVNYAYAVCRGRYLCLCSVEGALPMLMQCVGGVTYAYAVFGGVNYAYTMFRGRYLCLYNV